MTGSDRVGQFDGAKLALFIGDALLIYLRDDLPHIPYPGHWDFPGGGREGSETPAACALRETCEEFGLRIPANSLCFGRLHRCNPHSGLNWFFAAHLPPLAAGKIRFGEEGQCWRLVAPRAYGTMALHIPHLAQLLSQYLDSAQGRQALG